MVVVMKEVGPVENDFTCHKFPRFFIFLRNGPSQHPSDMQNSDCVCEFESPRSLENWNPPSQPYTYVQSLIKIIQTPFARTCN